MSLSDWIQVAGLGLIGGLLWQVYSTRILLERLAGQMESLHGRVKALEERQAPHPPAVGGLFR